MLYLEIEPATLTGVNEFGKRGHVCLCARVLLCAEEKDQYSLLCGIRSFPFLSPARPYWVGGVKVYTQVRAACVSDTPPCSLSRFVLYVSHITANHE